MTDTLSQGPTDADLLKLWADMQEDDLVGYFDFAEGVRRACAAGNFDGQRFSRLLSAVPPGQARRFRRETEGVVTAYGEDDARWGKERGELSLHLFGIPVAGDVASIEQLCRTEGLGDALVKAGFSSDYFAENSFCAILPVPLSLLDLAMVGPSQLYEVSKGLAAWLQAPEDEERVARVRQVLEGMRSQPPETGANESLYDATVLIGAQMRIDAPSIIAGPDGLMYQQVSGHEIEVDYCRKQWDEATRQIAKPHGVHIGHPLNWKAVRIILADMMLTQAIIQALRFEGRPLELEDIEVSFVAQDDKVDIRIFHEGSYLTNLPVSVQLLPDCLDDFLTAIGETYTIRPTIYEAGKPSFH